MLTFKPEQSVQMSAEVRDEPIVRLQQNLQVEWHMQITLRAWQAHDASQTASLYMTVNATVYIHILKAGSQGMCGCACHNMT